MLFVGVGERLASPRWRASPNFRRENESFGTAKPIRQIRGGVRWNGRQHSGRSPPNGFSAFKAGRQPQEPPPGSRPLEVPPESPTLFTLRGNPRNLPPSPPPVGKSLPLENRRHPATWHAVSARGEIPHRLGTGERLSRAIPEGGRWPKCKKLRKS